MDNTSNTLLPMMVESDDIGLGNARLMFGQITINRLVGPPLGAALFAAELPPPRSSTEAVLFAFGGVMNAAHHPVPRADRHRRDQHHQRLDHHRHQHRQQQRR